MMPQLSSAFFNWQSAIQMKVINKKAVDFELQEDVAAVVTFDAVIQAMKSRDVDRKSEGERTWKWWTMWSETKVQIDTTIQDPDGVEFKVQSVENWAQGGFYKYELTEQPKGLDMNQEAAQ